MNIEIIIRNAFKLVNNNSEKNIVQAKGHASERVIGVFKQLRIGDATIQRGFIFK